MSKNSYNHYNIIALGQAVLKFKAGSALWDGSSLLEIIGNPDKTW